MKTLKTIIAGSVLAAVIALAPTASALLITPTSVPQWSGPETSQDAINAIIGPIIAPATELYKANVGTQANPATVESGPFAANYATTFDNDPLDPSDALITHTGGAFISSANVFLLVKGGGPSTVAPLWYLFDISGWNGTESISIDGFWPRQGAISHVTLYGGQSTRVPDAGTSVLLLGAGLLGIGALRRRLAK